jgi:hypothetical protein
MITFGRKIAPVDEYETLVMSSIIASSGVPMKHRELGQNYMAIKRIFGFSAVAQKITNYELSLLKHRNFTTLENSSIKQINQELESLKKWSISDDPTLRDYADKLFEIRVKELKFLKSCSYQHVDSEMNDGYKALERYIERITE